VNLRARRSSTNLAAEGALAWLASAAFFLLAAVPFPLRGHIVVVLVLGGVYVYVVFLAAKRLGPLYAVPLAIAGGLAFDSFYIPPTRQFGDGDWDNWLVVAIYISMGVLIGIVAQRAVRRAEASEQARGRLADEQAALRRVATLVARNVPPSEVFAAVAREVGQLLDVDATHMGRYEPDGTATAVGSWSESGHHVPVGARTVVGGNNVTTLVLQTGRPARVDRYDDAPGSGVVQILKNLGVRSSVGAPIVVNRALWGVMVASSKHEAPLPVGTESRLTNFTDLVATAVSNAQARSEVARLADEQAALQRVATLVARQSSAPQVFAAVAGEVALLLGVEDTRMFRYEADWTATVVAAWGASGGALTVGTRLPLEGQNVAALVRRTERPARLDDYEGATGSIGSFGREAGTRSAVGAPIVVDGRLWGVMVAASMRSEGLPGDAESRIQEFTELVATAVSNAEARSDLAASRARIAAAADEERRRVVRDLHDGAQQRLVHTVVTLKMARRALQREGAAAPALVSEALDQAEAAMVEVRELARGILPSVLTWGGLSAGVAALASRMPVPVDVDVSVGRFSGAIEASAYFVVSEALTNVAKHSGATRAAVVARVTNSTLRIEIEDDGTGQADPNGHGLLGLADRLASIDGTLRVISVPAHGTKVIATVPVA
jgi:signal transduction histidine kinase